MRTYILQIDTATDVCSVSLSLNGQLVDSFEASEPNLHASKLTVFIEQLLQKVNVSFQDLSAVAVSKGPGSYTGLRIGVSTAKGLCYALDIPLIAVNTLESMYAGYLSNEESTDHTVYVPMLDARRMEVYMQIWNHNGEQLKDTAAVIIDEHTFAAYQNQQLVLFGSGAAKLQDILTQFPNIQIDTTYKHSSAYLTSRAFQKFEEKAFEDLIYFEPYYLKEFITTVSKKNLL